MRENFFYFNFSLMLMAVMGLGSGCASNFDVKHPPGTDINDYQTFYVEHLPADGRGINEVISEEMIKLGLKATTGEKSGTPSDVDAILTYEDRWMWDITMYMLSLTLNVRDATTNVLIATGQTTYTSLIRKEPSYMAREILKGIFRKDEKEEEQSPKED